MIFICTSGGGQRAAVWTMRSLQTADSLLNGKLMEHAFLITGASGGLVGASYYRELYLRQQSDSCINRYSRQYLYNISKDNLNSIAFSLVVSDLFFKYQKFSYKGHKYYKDRGYAFERQLNQNTGGILDKSIIDYREPERLAQIPMLIMAPTIVNDGRKLYISSQQVSYMNSPVLNNRPAIHQKLKGVEFLRLFSEQDATQLRFLSALRMNATFPYITPNVALPCEPVMEVMDAGLSDNYGVSDAVRFLYIFREWISENTSGIVFLAIRDTPKEPAIDKNTHQSLFEKIFTPIGSLYQNWSYLQDINNDNSLEFAQSWYKGRLSRIELHYTPYQTINFENILPKQSKNGKIVEKVSLSWHLTEREKASLSLAIYDFRNQKAISLLAEILD
jgi:hypothetical protein